MTRKEKWLKALRGEEYKQASSSLYTGRGYCCLGLLAELDGNLPIRPPRYKNDIFLGVSSRGDRMFYSIGLPLVEAHRLADKNDMGQSFKEIADYIEKYVEVE